VNRAGDDPSQPTPPAAFADAPRAFRNILISRLDGLGDIVLGTCLTDALHRLYPDARLTLLVRPALESVREILPNYLDVRALPLDPRDPIDGYSGPWVDALQTALRSAAPDLFILGEYNRVWSSEIAAEHAHPSRVISFRGHSGLNFTHAAIQAQMSTPPQPPAAESIDVDEFAWEPVKYRAMIARLGDAPPRPPTIAVPEHAWPQAQDVWDAVDLPPDKTVIFFPSSGDMLNKSLDSDTWLRWIEHIHDRHGLQALVLGSDLDADCLAPLFESLPHGYARSWCLPRAQVGLLAALLAGARAYIGADTGPMHVAAALNRPTLGVYGGGHGASRFLPAGRHALALRMPIACYRCDWWCPFPQRECIKQIPMDSLLATGDRLLAGDVDHDPLDPETIDAPAPQALTDPTTAAAMRVYRFAGTRHHESLERLEALRGDIGLLFDQVHAQGAKRDTAIAHINATLAEMSRQNEKRDAAINELTGRMDRLHEALHPVARWMKGDAQDLTQIQSDVRALQDVVSDLKRRALRIPWAIYYRFKRR